MSFDHDASVLHPIRNTAELIVAYRSTSSIDDLRRTNLASLAYRLLLKDLQHEGMEKVAAVGIFALWSVTAVAITINDFTVVRNDRFASGYPNGPLVPNTDPSFIGIGYDWSGVGWYMTNGNITYALITPRQMLVANHYLPSPGIGSNIQFVSSGGQVTSVTVQSEPGSHSDSPTFASDMATAQFSSVIPQSAGITTYPILFQGYNANTYAGYNLLSCGQDGGDRLEQDRLREYGHQL